MELDVISYQDVLASDSDALQKLESALLRKGIVGMRGVPEFVTKTQAYIAAAREFCALDEAVKQQSSTLPDGAESVTYSQT